MDKKKYVILEIIPTALDPKKGEIAQLSALKLNGLNLIDRFDYRLNDDKIKIEDIKNMISYDKKSFNYVDSKEEILTNFQKFIEDYDLLIIDNEYTANYLEDIENKKESIFKYLKMDFSDDVIEKVIDKYKLEPSNYIVDLLYEALIFESNNKE
ncbi:MAG: hypothetical protein Q4E39_06500 [bacterium]|nr:hypothetical protein [bacterium]